MIQSMINDTNPGHPGNKPMFNRTDNNTMKDSFDALDKYHRDLKTYVDGLRKQA